MDDNLLEVQDTSEHSKRGKHTTTKREMYVLNSGGVVIDNPGTREVGIAKVGSGLDEVFDDIVILSQKCKYTDCTHTHEDDCAVKNAVADGRLDERRYDSYCHLIEGDGG